MKIKQSIDLLTRDRKLITRVRERKGLTVGQLAEAVGVSRPMVAMVESGQKPAPAALLAKIARRLDLVFEAQIVAEMREKNS